MPKKGNFFNVDVAKLNNFALINILSAIIRKESIHQGTLLRRIHVSSGNKVILIWHFVFVYRMVICLVKWRLMPVNLNLPSVVSSLR